MRLAAALFALLLGAATPPPTPIEEASDTYFGRTITDPYRWMESGGPLFDEWLVAQGRHAEAVLQTIPGRAALRARLHALNVGETRVSAVQARGDRYFFLRAGPEEELPQLYVRDGGPGQSERLLVDPRRFDEGRRQARIDYWSVSWDGAFVAYGISVGGAETGTLRVVDAATGGDLPDRIDRTRYAAPRWRDDHRSFFYARLPPPPSPGAATLLTGGRVYLHVLGANPDAAVPVFGPNVAPALGLADNRFSTLGTTPGSRWLVAIASVGLPTSDLELFVAPADTVDGPATPWRRITTVADQVRRFAVRGDTLYLLSARDAPQRKVLRMSLMNADLARAETVVPEGSETIAELQSGADALYLRLLDSGRGRVLRLPWQGGPTEPINMPFDGAITDFSADPRRPGVVVTIQSWIRSPTVFEFDPDLHRFTDIGLAPPSAVDFGAIETVRENAASSDGTLVPLTILTRRGPPRDGAPHPVGWLRRLWCDLPTQLRPAGPRLARRGGRVCRCTCARRRGTRRGMASRWPARDEAEHRRRLCCLRRAPYSGRVDAPDAAGWLWPQCRRHHDRRRNHHSARPLRCCCDRCGDDERAAVRAALDRPINTAEFGSVRDERGFKSLLAIDAYQAVRAGVAYPAVLLTAGANDPRVSAWMPGKMAARLQAVAGADGRPVWLRVNEVAGHAGAGRAALEDELADRYSFLLWQAGVAAYQPLH